MDIEKITVWDGTRFRKAIGKVMTTDGLKDFYRPIDFQDDMITPHGIIRQLNSTTASIVDGKLIIPTLIKYKVYDSSAIFSLNADNQNGDIWNDEIVGRVGHLTNFDSSSGWTIEGLSFDGRDDYVEFENILAMGFDSLTICVEVKTSSIGIQNILSKFSTGYPNGYAVRITNGYPRMIIRDDTGAAINFQGTKFVADNEWHNIIYVFDRQGKASIYVDGVLDTAVDISAYANKDITSPITLKIGAMEHASLGVANLFEGVIKKIEVFNYVYK